MENHMTTTTAQRPSRFGMPACGHRSLVTLGATVAPIQGTTAPAAGSAERQDVWGLAPRDRHDVIDAVVLKATTGTGTASFPGTTAWRPPTC